MIPFLGAVAATLMGVGIIWRLRQARARAAAVARPAATRHGPGAQPRQSSALWPPQQAPKAAATGVPEAVPAGSTAPLTAAREPRRSDRVLIRIPLQVSGKDLDGNPFTERAQTMAIKIGDRVLVRLASPEGPGEAEFRARIVWCRRAGPERGNLYGLKLGPAAAGSSLLKDVA